MGTLDATRAQACDSIAGAERNDSLVNPIVAAPAVVFGAMALAPRAGELAAAPLDFLDALRQAVGKSAEAPAAKPAAQPREAELATPRELRRKLEAALESLHRKLSARLAAEGIDTTRPFQAEWSDRGRVHVALDHPEADKIRRVLSDDRELAQAAAEIRQLAELLRSSRDRGSDLVLSYSPQGLTAGQ
jgi:hypothetical protein